MLGLIVCFLRLTVLRESLELIVEGFKSELGVMVRESLELIVEGFKSELEVMVRRWCGNVAGDEWKKVVVCPKTYSS